MLYKSEEKQLFHSDHKLNNKKRKNKMLQGSIQFIHNILIWGRSVEKQTEASN